MVDRAALEMRCTGNCTGGSNPSLSAELERQSNLSLFFCALMSRWNKLHRSSIHKATRYARQLFEGGLFSPLGLSRSHTPHQTMFDCGAPSMMAAPFESLPFRKVVSDRISVALFLLWSTSSILRLYLYYI